MARLFEGNVQRADDDEQRERPVAAPERQPAGQREPVATALVVTDSSGLFTVVAALSWVALVAAPLLLSIALDRSLQGAPLLGVILWLALLRVARWLSPAAHADSLARRGRYVEALALCDRSLAVTGAGAWVGRRRLVWLNRRVTALLGLGRYDQALLAAIEALESSPDPETIANCAVALLRLNRFAQATETARLVAQLTHERSVRANATLAWAMLARGQPAEAEAMAQVSLADIQALTPYVRRENHAASLSALCRSQRALGLNRSARATLARLRRVIRGAPALSAITLLEEAGFLADDPVRAAELVMRARVNDAAYTGWYLTQPDALDFLRETAGIAPLAAQAEAEIQRMSACAPDDSVFERLLRLLRSEARPRPPYLSSAAALATQIITLSATLALLLLWMWRFFISQSM